MAEFIAFDANTEVMSDGIQFLIESLDDDGLKIMAKHKLLHVEFGTWVLLQRYLDAYKDIFENSFLDLVALGKNVPNHSQFPSEITTLADSLHLLDAAYKMNHRGGDIGEYRVEFIGFHRAKVIARNPYPSDFDFGLLCGLAEKFLPDGADYQVQRDMSAPSRTRGDDSCTYWVRWSG